MLSGFATVYYEELNIGKHQHSVHLYCSKGHCYVTCYYCAGLHDAALDWDGGCGDRHGPGRGRLLGSHSGGRFACLGVRG